MTSHERDCMIVLSSLAILQSGHMVEHVAQFVQWMLHLRLAQGFIGQFDLEPIHFAFNGMVLVGLSLLCTFYADVLRARGGRRAHRALLFAMAAETYHTTEHVAKFMQYVETGIQGTPGILGRYIPLVPAHFAINLATTIPLDPAFVALAMRLVLPRFSARPVTEER